jgi:hypothetical protein
MVESSTPIRETSFNISGGMAERLKAIDLKSIVVFDYRGDHHIWGFRPKLALRTPAVAGAWRAFFMCKNYVLQLTTESLQGRIRTVVRDFLVDRRALKRSPKTIRYYDDELNIFTIFWKAVASSAWGRSRLP